MPGKPKSKENTKAAAPPVSPAGTSATTATYSLTPERSAVLQAEAAALGNTLPAFPGRLAQRVRRSGEIRIAAERDAADLVRTPFHKVPPLTLEEIRAQRDRIEFLRDSESRFQAIRGSQKEAFTKFEELGGEAETIKIKLLRAFDLLYTNNPKGRNRVSDIRANEGDPDLVQDVSDILLLCGEEKEYIDSCPRGEAADVVRLRELSPQLSHYLAAKGMSEEAVKARRRRDAAYTLVMQTETRFRLAATYWYDGTEKVKDYAAFVAPAKGAPADDSVTDDGEAPEPAPEPTGVATPAKPRSGEG
jgi:hypothetical protein